MNEVMLTAMSMGDRVAYAGRMTLIGMLTVFSALAILWGALALFRIVLQRKSGEKVTEASPKAASVAPAAPVSPVSPAPTTNDSEIVAAITAAISVMLAEENGGTVQGFRVVSFRRMRGNAK